MMASMLVINDHLSQPPSEKPTSQCFFTSRKVPATILVVKRGGNMVTDKRWPEKHGHYSVQVGYERYTPDQYLGRILPLSHNILVATLCFRWFQWERNLGSESLSKFAFAASRLPKNISTSRFHLVLVLMDV